MTDMAPKNLAKHLGRELHGVGVMEELVFGAVLYENQPELSLIVTQSCTLVPEIAWAAARELGILAEVLVAFGSDDKRLFGPSTAYTDSGWKQQVKVVEDFADTHSIEVVKQEVWIANGAIETGQVLLTSNELRREYINSDPKAWFDDMRDSAKMREWLVRKGSPLLPVLDRLTDELVREAWA